LYVVDGILAGPVWAEVAYGSVVPRMPIDRTGWIALAASLGTTLAPWGLAFIQSYAVDKKITLASLRWERVDVIVGSVLTGVVGLAIAVACAATLHKAGVHIESAGDAAAALRPLAGSFATLFFGVGLLGSSLLAAAIVPIATSYSIAEGVGEPASLGLDSKHFHWFYAAFVGLTVAGVSVVALPGLPLIPLIYSSQVLNAAVLPLHIAALLLLVGNADIMGDARASVGALARGWISFALVLACLGGLTWSWIS
jgi:Mn2+/Fe2+ NRAMP family transporter